MTVQAVVWAILTLMGIIAIFAILYALNQYLARQFPEGYGKFAWVVNVALAVLAALLAIGFILDLMGYPLVRFGP